MDNSRSKIHKLDLVFPKEVFTLAGALHSDEHITLETITTDQSRVRVNLKRTAMHINCVLEQTPESQSSLVELLGDTWHCELNLFDEVAYSTERYKDISTLQRNTSTEENENSTSNSWEGDVIKNEQNDENQESSGSQLCSSTTPSHSLLSSLESLAKNQIKTESTLTNDADDADASDADDGLLEDNSDSRVSSEAEWCASDKDSHQRPKKRKLPRKQIDQSKPLRSSSNTRNSKKEQKIIPSRSRARIGTRCRKMVQTRSFKEQVPIKIDEVEVKKGRKQVTTKTRGKPRRVDGLGPLLRYQCIECAVLRTDQDDLVKHFKENHKQVRNYLLKLIKIDQAEYESNMPELEDQEETINCPFCDIERRKGAVLRHLSDCHDMLPEYDQCYQLFSASSIETMNMYQPPLVLTEPVKCIECEMRFTDGNVLYKHYDDQHRKNDEPKDKLMLIDDQVYKNSERYMELPYLPCLDPHCKRDRQGAAFFRHLCWCHNQKILDILPLLPVTKSATRTRKPKFRRGPNKQTVEIGRNTCKFCLHVFETFSSKSKHISSCPDNPNRRDMLLCRFCCHTTPYPDKMEEHMKKHLEKYVCELCAEQFQYKSTFYLHKRKAHGIGKPIECHKCSICNKEYASKSSYKRHLFTHADVNSFTCEACGKGFKYERNLTLHRNTVHLGIFPYHCEKCGYGLPKIEKLLSHRCERIRNRHREVGNAAEIRAKFKEGISPTVKVLPVKKVTGWRKRRIPGSQERKDNTLYYPHNMEEFHEQLAEKEQDDSSNAIKSDEVGNVRGMIPDDVEENHHPRDSSCTGEPVAMLTSLATSDNQAVVDHGNEISGNEQPIPDSFCMTNYYSNYPGVSSSLPTVPNLPTPHQQQPASMGWQVRTSHLGYDPNGGAHQPVVAHQREHSAVNQLPFGAVPSQFAMPTQLRSSEAGYGYHSHH